MDRKLLPVTALVATTLLLNQRPSVDEYVAHAKSPPVAAATADQHRNAASSTSPADASEAECAIGAHCDALVPLRDTGPWVASCAWFGTHGQAPSARSESLKLQDSDPEQLGYDVSNWCLTRGAGSAHLKFLIVTVPDPTTTHLALYFDRSIEAIERAAHQYRLYLTRYWLPWSVQETGSAGGNTSEDLRVNDILRDYRSAQPGVLVFTGGAPAGHDESATFVFLVGESPTSGINKTQFKNAAHYTDTLCKWVGSDHCPRNPIAAVGPFFSGSVLSVIDLKTDLEARQEKIDFVSGSMSSAARAEILRKNGLESFDDTQQGDEQAEAVLLQFLDDQGLTRDGGRNIAILQEDETGFSGELSLPRLSACANWPNIVGLTFPRELTRLRNASADSLTRPVAIPGENVPPIQALSWNWGDTGKGEDHVPSFSGGQEPLSIQAVLQSIAEVIRQEHIQYVGIVATDVFDILYLSRFLKMSVPNTRLFVLDSDLLMVHSGGEGRELDGTLAVTTYPLIERSDGWGARVPIQPAPQSLPSRLTQGLYNAVYLQLSRGGAGNSDDTPKPLHSGARFADAEPVWITMVGRAGFWPVSLWQSGSSESTLTCHSPTPLSGPQINRTTFDPPDATTTLLEGALLLWGILHLVGMWFGSRMRFSWLEQFRVRPAQDRRRHAQYQTYYLICATLALSAMLALTVISVGCLWLRGTMASYHPMLVPMVDVARAVVALALVITAAYIAPRNDSRLIRPGLVRYLPWVAYVCTIVGWIWVSIRSDTTGAFFTQRAVYLGNGVSPLLPLEFLILIYYAWSWTFIRKVRLSERKQIRVPELEHLGLEGRGFSKCCAVLKQTTDRLVFNPAITLWMVGCFIAAMLVLIRPWHALRSVEGLVYDRGFVVVFSYICLMIVLVWGRYMYIWSILSRILRGLERTALRRAFSRLPQSVYSWSPLWYENAQRRAHTISSRSLECFQAIVCRGGYGFDAEERLKEITEAFGRVVALDNSGTIGTEGSSKGDERSKAAVRLQRLFMDTAKQLLRCRLTPYWRKGGSDTLDEETHARVGSEKLTPEAELRYLEEEFVALRYVGLIHYESAQLKNLVMLLVTSFVLALLSIGSYPFLAGRLFVWTMAGVFVLFGAGIIVSFAQMSRDAILSRLSGTDAGKLDLGFYLRVLSFGALPLLALLASQFPSFGRALTSWLEPALSAMH